MVMGNRSRSRVWVVVRVNVVGVGGRRGRRRTGARKVSTMAWAACLMLVEIVEVLAAQGC